MAERVFSIEAQAIKHLTSLLTPDFDTAINYLLNCKGRIVVCGIGKSGLVGKKIAATLASTGSPSFFLHPSEAIHGDLGVLMPQDCFISISNSGETDEILQLLPHIQQLKLPHITLVGNPKSTLAKKSDAILNIQVEEEASPISVVPMASTTTTMAMGDAIATVLITLRAFNENDFARFHPGGSLGRKLVTEVEAEMQRNNLPTARIDTAVKEVIVSMSQGIFGMVVILDEQQKIVGVITDGDLRRSLNKFPSHSFFELKAKDMMSTNPKMIQANCPLWEADQLMLEHKITALPVEENGYLIGIIAKHQIK
nr:KpsF/GutQ family sugar-phosphate isomerase [Aureispira anguillae]